ncbi:MAG: germination protein YpeB [Clostridia bacterium]|nr:germination protein YpeB [Clostridia bacterium]
MRREWIVSIILAVALVATGVWGYMQYQEKQDYHQYVENLYQKSFYEMSDNVQNIETQLSKLMVAASPQQIIPGLSEVWRQASVAQNNLGQMPVSHLALDNASRFLNQVGDYCYYLAKETSYERPFTQEQWKKLEQLHNNAAKLNDDLKKMQSSISKGGVDIGDIRLAARKPLEEASEDIVSKGFKDMNKNLADYPELIYDGPFSEHIETAKPLGLTGAEVSQKQAENKAIEFVGKDRVKKIKKVAEGNGLIKTYGFEVTPSGKEQKPIYVDVSKKGGHIVWMISSDTSEEKKMDLEQGTKKAKEFMEQKGFGTMEVTYTEHYDGMLLVNFAAVQDDVIIYPDLIKVEVSLEDGEILGFEAAGYLMSHRKRDIPEPKISKKEAMGYVSGRFDVKSSRLAIIPTPAKKEKFCYEFMGNFGEDTFIVYIDAVTGQEESILKVIVTEGGKLTM